LLRAGEESALTWQIVRQQESATVRCQLVGSRGEFDCVCMPDYRASQVNFCVISRSGAPANDLKYAIPGPQTLQLSFE
jgi:hypothetical protein